MKKLILLMLIGFISLVAKSEVPVAVLSHGDTTTSFYGANALIEAVEAAVDGDAISLSPGCFASQSEYNKILTIKGSGMDIESENCTRITNGPNNYGVYIDIWRTGKNVSNGDFVMKNLYVDEGVHSNTPINLILEKCSVKWVGHNHDEGNVHLNVSSCVIREFVSRISCESVFSNSFIQNDPFHQDYIEAGNMHFFKNCILQQFKVGNSIVENSIFTDLDNQWHLPATSTASNCKAISMKYKCPYFFEWHIAGNEYFYEEKSVFFKPDTFYELQDEYASTWLGTDGTQVGIYGGAEPFTTTPAGPRIVKFEVDSKTDAQGKLKVDIELAGSGE